MENYFSKDNLPHLRNEYVCWLDIMGMRSLMELSIESASIVICRFHTCLSKSIKNQVDDNALRVYPIMDGAFITSENKESLIIFLKNVFTAVGNDFIDGVNKEIYLYQYLLRGSIAFGPIRHGNEIKNTIIQDDYKKILLFGLPMIQAYKSGNKAAPFGIYVDKSARAFASDGARFFSTRWHMWFSKDEKELVEQLKMALTKYYEWSKKMSHFLSYDHDTIKLHEEMSMQYFNYYVNNPLAH